MSCPPASSPHRASAGAHGGGAVGGRLAQPRPAGGADRREPGPGRRPAGRAGGGQAELPGAGGKRRERGGVRRVCPGRRAVSRGTHADHARDRSGGRDRRVRGTDRRQSRSGRELGHLPVRLGWPGLLLWRPWLPGSLRQGPWPPGPGWPPASRTAPRSCRWPAAGPSRSPPGRSCRPAAAGTPGWPPARPGRAGRGAGGVLRMPVLGPDLVALRAAWRRQPGT